MYETELRKICKHCVENGYPVSWIRDNRPAIWSACSFEHIYSVYSQERRKAMQGRGVSPITFLF